MLCKVRLRNKKCSETEPEQHCSGPEQYQYPFRYYLYWWLHWWVLMIGESECYKWLHTVLCSWCWPKTDMYNTHVYTDVVSVIYRCRQVTPSIGIGTLYRYRSRPKVSVSEVSVNCGIGLTLIHFTYLCDVLAKTMGLQTLTLLVDVPAEHLHFLCNTVYNLFS